MTKKTRRFIYLIFVLSFLGIGLGLILYGMQDHLVYFVTPSDDIKVNQTVRLGGIVKNNSLKKSANTPTITFIITDGKKDQLVEFTGITPDLFREGQGVVAQGSLAADQVFYANRILAKHDENYMPPPLKKALTKNMPDVCTTPTSNNSKQS